MQRSAIRFAAAGLAVAALSFGSLASANAQAAGGAARPARHFSAHLVMMPGTAVAKLARSGPAALPVRTARLARALTRLEASSGATADQVNCWTGAAILAGANNDFVSAEMAYSGADYAMLRARATAIGPWELWDGCRDESTGETFIYSDDNGDYVSAELAYSGSNYAEMRARATAIGPWEQWFTASDPCNGCGTYFWNGDNGDFASAEIAYSGSRYGELRARASSVGPWEEYAW